MSSISLKLPLETKSLRPLIPFFAKTSAASVLINLSISRENIADLNTLSLMVLNLFINLAVFNMLPESGPTEVPISPNSLNNCLAMSELPSFGSLKTLVNISVSIPFNPNTISFSNKDWPPALNCAVPSLTANSADFLNSASVLFFASW